MASSHTRQTASSTAYTSGGVSLKIILASIFLSPRARVLAAPVPQGLVGRINRFNAAHPWSHNDFYHPWVLRQLPNGMSRTIDPGCGTGNLVRAISARALAAEGIDADADIIAVAQRENGSPAKVSFSVGNLMEIKSVGRYDTVTAVTVIHPFRWKRPLTRLGRCWPRGTSHAGTPGASS